MWSAGYSVKFIDEIRKDAIGGAILSEWLGAGGVPVPQTVAETRSKTCETCPENIAPNWWEKNKGKIAEAIKRHLGIKHEMALKVSNERKLHMCKVCGCCISTKVWVPIEHIAHHTSTAQIKEFPSHCWIVKELLNP